MGTVFNEYDFDFPNALVTKSNARELWESALADQGIAPDSPGMPTYTISYSSETVTPTYFYTLRIWSTALTSAGLPAAVLAAISALGLVEVP